MKFILFISFFTLSLSGCVTQQTTTNSEGVVIEDKYVIERPLKKFIKKVEFE